MPGRLSLGLRLKQTLVRLCKSERGVAFTEFAIAAPTMAALGLLGMETANLALTYLRISQISSNLADTASRIGESSPLALKKIRESDINDAMEAVRLQSGSTPITTRGRIILTSLEQNADGGQFIRWQRCLGLAHYNSAYTVGTGATGTAFPGIGPVGKEIKAPASSAVMFVEVIYKYKPIVTDAIFGERVLHSKASFLVRDRRDLSSANNPSNPAPAVTAATCDRYTA
jgi:Flp pilus assembly protein TadG